MDGGNPLEVLYGNLSGPLHCESDEEGVAIASMLLDSLLFLFESLKQRSTRFYLARGRPDLVE